MALDITTYIDILVRARPSSALPSDVVKKSAQIAGIDALASDEGDAPTNRRSGAGALMGYGVGLGAGIVYSALRPAFRAWLPWPMAGVLLGAATLVVSEGSATALGATDWSKWSLGEWIADIVPRAMYGLTAAYVVERIDRATATADRSIESGLDFAERSR